MDSEGLEKNIGSTHETLSVLNHLLGWTRDWAPLRLQNNVYRLRNNTFIK